MRTHTHYYARSEYHTQLANTSFDEIFDLTAGVYFFEFFIYCMYILWSCMYVVYMTGEERAGVQWGGRGWGADKGG